MKKILTGFVFLIALIVGVVACSTDEPRATRDVRPVPERSSQAAQAQIHMHEYAARGRVPAYYTTAPDVATLPPPLSPELFTDNKRLAYVAAKEIPEVLAQLPCYCHCDRGHGHKSLHSCFESEHGEECGICISEALMASTLKKQGAGIEEIRNQIIAAYARP